MKVYVLPADAYGCGQVHAQATLGNTGQYTIVDISDVDLLISRTWHLLQVGYVADSYRVYLHRLIMRPEKGKVVDHKDRDPLNNCRSNLRLATRGQNGANRKPDTRIRGTTSRFKGVCWQEDRKRWAAYIHIDGKTNFLGRFTQEHDAAAAYDKAALETWGEFALLNYLQEVVPR